ncbi:MAG TPA: hypothetical protein VM692_02215 [Gammaproteobacteria bacterium]|nr:hypothetical protein [Gammaproteobacteria bacterium]
MSKGAAPPMTQPPVAPTGTAAAQPVPQQQRHGRTAASMAVQVVLIALGVFLGLAGEEWRGDRENHRLAIETLQRFRTEVTANREAVAQVKDYHSERHAELIAYFAATEEQKSGVALHIAGIQPPRFERTAWDLALATGTLTYIDSELAFALSRTYAVQATTDQLGRGLTDAMYLRSPDGDPEGFFSALKLYYDDLTEIEPNLLPVYDKLLTAIDEALAK